MRNCLTANMVLKQKVFLHNTAKTGFFSLLHYKQVWADSKSQDQEVNILYAHTSVTMQLFQCSYDISLLFSKLHFYFACFCLFFKWKKHQHDPQINHQWSNLIWRYNSSVCWNIQPAFPALNHWCGFKAWLDSRDQKICLWWSALQHAPLLKISETPRVVVLLMCRIFWSHRTQGTDGPHPGSVKPPEAGRLGADTTLH